MKTLRTVSSLLAFALALTACQKETLNDGNPASGAPIVQGSSHGQGYGCGEDDDPTLALLAGTYSGTETIAAVQGEATTTENKRLEIFLEDGALIVTSAGQSPATLDERQRFEAYSGGVLVHRVEFRGSQLYQYRRTEDGAERVFEGVKAN